MNFYKKNRKSAPTNSCHSTISTQKRHNDVLTAVRGPEHVTEGHYGGFRFYRLKIFQRCSLSHGVVCSASAAQSPGMMWLEILWAPVNLQVSETQISAMQLFKQQSFALVSAFSFASVLFLKATVTVTSRQACQMAALTNGVMKHLRVKHWFTLLMWTVKK